MTCALALNATARTCCLTAAGVMAVALLAGCVSQSSGGPAVTSRAKPGAYQASVSGTAISGEIRPGTAGKILTAAGARPVPGYEVFVMAGTGLSGLGSDQGKLAKEGARQLCAEAGGRFNDRAVGHHLAGRNQWIFPGGCA